MTLSSLSWVMGISDDGSDGFQPHFDGLGGS